jgi:hypothetical protein
MKLLPCIAVLFTASLAASRVMSADAPTAKQFLQLAGSEDGRDLADVKIISVEQGINVANAHLASHPLYCQPAALVLTGPQLADMVGRAVAADKKLEDVPLPAVLLGVLQKTFPCAPAAP